MNDLSNYRKSYEKSELLESNIPEDPINLFNRWFHEVEDFGGESSVLCPAGAYRKIAQRLERSRVRGGTRPI